MSLQLHRDKLYAICKYFQILVDRRSDAAQIVILLTDGKPNSRVGDTEPEARRVKDLGIRVVAIGVTKSIDEPQLRRIASTPNDVITTVDFASLAGKVNAIIGVACSGTRPPPPPVITPRPPGKHVYYIKLNINCNLM